VARSCGDFGSVLKGLTSRTVSALGFVITPLLTTATVKVQSAENACDCPFVYPNILPTLASKNIYNDFEK